MAANLYAPRPCSVSSYYVDGYPQILEITQLGLLNVCRLPRCPDISALFKNKVFLFLSVCHMPGHMYQTPDVKSQSGQAYT